MMASLALATRASGGSVRVRRLVSNPSTRYLERMGLFRMMGIESGIAVTEHEAAGRFIPLRQIGGSSELNDFVVEVVPLLHTNPTDAAPVKYVLYELIRNVLEHARSRGGAIVSAQVTKSGRLLIGVADSGRGIRRSLAQYHPVSGDRAAIALAMRPGVTGVTKRLGGNETNGGAGLFFLKAMAIVARHHMVAISGDALFKLLTVPPERAHIIQADVARDRVTWRKLECPWNGTAVGIDLTLESGGTFTNLLRLIGRVYDVDVRDQKRATYRARFGNRRDGNGGK
jgi:anti-sigma regulatory factor (Ser/Thr protein kinase)